jgi:hypothetical protein
MGIWISLAVIWVVCGGFAAYLASEKSRSGSVWFLLGLLFGPLGLIAAAGLPSASAGATNESPESPQKPAGLEDLQTSMTRE